MNAETVKGAEDISTQEAEASHWPEGTMFKTIIRALKTTKDSQVTNKQKKVTLQNNTSSVPTTQMRKPFTKYAKGLTTLLLIVDIGIIHSNSKSFLKHFCSQF